MSLELDPRCRARLIELIAEKLPAMRVRDNHNVDFESSWPLAEANKALPTKINDELSDYIDDVPLYTFVMEYIDGLLSHKLTHDADAPETLLLDLLEVERTDLAHKIVDDFCALPRQYQLASRLNQYVCAALLPLLDQHHSMNISSHLTIVRVDDGYQEKFALPKLSFGLLGLAKPPIMIDDILLVIKKNGFITHFGSTKTVAHAVSDLKAFVGIGIALGLFDDASLSPPPDMQRSTAGLIVHRRLGDKWNYLNTKELPPRVSKFIESLKISRPELTNGKLTAVQKTYADMVQGHRIALAGEWFFDSRASENDLVAFVQGMIVMEILFGDENQSGDLGLQRLIANRCAYLIANSIDFRNYVIRRFPKIYKVRSKIVHSGKTHLTREEKEFLFELRMLCAMSIKAEIGRIV